MKRMIGLVLVLLVTSNSIVAAAVDANKIKSEIAKRGTGENARVRITTRDHAEFKGYISEIGDTTFVLTFKHPSETRTLSYADVAGVKGSGLTTLGRAGVGVGVLAAATGVAAAVFLKKCGKFCR